CSTTMPKALRTLRLSFRETHLTHFGGMVLLQRFRNKLGLRRLLQQWIRIPQRNADYHPSDLILALLYAIMAGLRRINKTDILQYNGTFLSLLGLPRFPDQSTLRRFPDADASQGHSSTGGPARPLANQVVSFAEAAHDFDLRSR